MRRVLPFSTLLAIFPIAAHGQVYLDSTRSEAFVPIALIPGIHDLRAISFNNADNGSVAITPLPFAFNFFGADYTRVNLGSNGFVTFGTDAATSATNPVPAASTSAPNAWIAPLWDDLIHPVVANARWGIVGMAPNRIVVLEAGPASRRTATTGTLFYQVWLFEGLEGRFEYRVTGDAAFALDATIGYEGAAGRRGSNAGACLPANACATVPDGTTFVTQRARPPELSGTLTAPRGALPGTPVDAPVTLRNLGVDTATGVLATVYLSSNNTLDAADVIVGTVGPIDVDARTAGTTTTARIVVPGTVAAGDYVVLLDTDSADDWVEVDEVDNLFFTAARFATAYELRPSSITIRAPVPAAPGENLGLTIPVQNDGIPRTGPVTVELFASIDRIVNANDIALGTVMVTLTGADPQSIVIDLPLPALALGGYYPIAAVDAANAPAEIIPTNNTIIGTTRLFVGADFAITSVTLPAQLPPGSPVLIRTRLDSAGAPYVGPVSYQLYASLDAVIDGGDTLLGDFVVDFTREDFRDDSRTLTMPAAPGRYYAIARVDPANTIVEIDETNNTRASGTGINAPDLSISATTFTPAQVPPGGTATVTATLRSLGLTVSGYVSYGIYLSRDSTVDAGDFVLRTSSVTMATTTRTLTDRVRIPSGIPPGSYRVLVAADVAGLIAELDETNNLFASTTRLAIPGAELEVISVTGSSTTVEGQPYAVTLTLSNRGILDAPRFSYVYYASANPLIRLTDTRVLLSGTSSIGAGALRTFTDSVVLPVPTGTTTIYLGVIVDVFGEVPEVSEIDNVARVPHPIVITVPRADLRADALSAQLGARQLVLTRRVSNRGTADAEVDLAYYLSTNTSISPADLALGRVRRTVVAGQADDAMDTVSLPTGVAPGTYYVGLLVDPDQAVLEVDETNNATTSAAIDVVDATLALLTETLPAGRLGVPYRTTLTASGGITYQWSVTSGALPPGLTLDAASGVVSGNPSAVGSFGFTIAVESGAARGERMFEVEVAGVQLPLRVVTAALPFATANQPYAVALLAAGGVGSVRWSAEMPPADLTLSPSGLLSGSAVTSHRFTVVAEDALGARATRELSLVVIPVGGGLSIATAAIPAAVAAAAYCGEVPVALVAAGGQAPYAWALAGPAPAGMTLSATGELCGTPPLAGTFPIDVRVTDAANVIATAPLTLEVRSADGLAITTTALPAGQVGTAYAATLVTARGQAPTTLELFADGGRLPAGLVLSPQGGISGTPTLEGEFAFRVLAADAAGVIDVQTLAIRITRPEPVVVVPPAPEASGCGCRTGAPAGDAVLTLLAVLAMMTLRRRR